jgi:hypothetical protein
LEQVILSEVQSPGDLPPKVSWCTQGAARELGPNNIHVAHLIIDAGVDTAWVRDRIRERESDAALTNLAPGRLMRPEAVAEAYWQFYQQPPDA